MQGRTRAHALPTLHPVADTMRFHPYLISCKPDWRKPVTNKIYDMKAEQKYSFCARCIHRMKNEPLPDLCSWAGVWAKDVDEKDCWYHGAPPHNQW